jgi:hypothetical protein
VIEGVGVGVRDAVSVKVRVSDGVNDTVSV